MHIIATTIDALLYATLALSLYLSAYKTIDLWAPKYTQKPTTMSVDQFLFQKEKYLTILSLIASVAPFFGLAGTVAHISIALLQMNALTDTSLLTKPIATALTSTLLGILACLPALCTYHLATRQIFVLERRFSQEA